MQSAKVFANHLSQSIPPPPRRQCKLPQQPSRPLQAQSKAPSSAPTQINGRKRTMTKSDAVIMSSRPGDMRCSAPVTHQCHTSSNTSGRQTLTAALKGTRFGVPSEATAWPQANTTIQRATPVEPHRTPRSACYSQPPLIKSTSSSLGTSLAPALVPNPIPTFVRPCDSKHAVTVPTRHQA